MWLETVQTGAISGSSGNCTPTAGGHSKTSARADHESLNDDATAVATAVTAHESRLVALAQPLQWRHLPVHLLAIISYPRHPTGCSVQAHRRE